MNIPDRIKKLIEVFHANLEFYKKGIYNETQVRTDYINPLFEELGWDISNTKGISEAYRDVIEEYSIKTGGVTKAPDYCFRIGGVRKFFLEAKKPSVNIKESIHPAYQLRRYGWSAKLPLSILTDFEEFAVYDCRVKPARTDKASHSRILYLKYTDYAEKWEEIANIFSRDAVLNGSFDQYAEAQKAKKGSLEVDAAFLQEIENWRELLARSIALRNPNLTQRELNFAVQQTIDRIVFLRICEDRGIETYGSLMALQNGKNVYRQMVDLFRRADAKYNSDLFHFRKEKHRDVFDRVTPGLSIDDKPLKDMLKNLYYPDSPYEFSVLPADILGQVYEKFLGKVIRLTAGHQAKVEEKPEVRKAGGVYYTPTYIVDYIVRNTAGKLLDGKKPGNVKNMTILDPACGSGSFLIGAYQFLLDWHLNQYVSDNPEKKAKGKKPVLYQTDKGEWRLTTEERKRILLRHIYGVDIDSQAVEVTKLSLLLKVLEGENEQSIQMSVFQERILPDLSNNIKCGNSLIGPDFYANQQIKLNEEEIYRVNAFDWNAEFAEIMKAGGFDAVIGNPPWGADLFHIEYFHKNYPVSSDMKEINSYIYFIDKGLNLLNNTGFFSYIVPDTLLSKYQYASFRKYLYNSYTVSSILETVAVFEEAKATPNIVIAITKQTPDSSFEITRYLADHRKPVKTILDDIHQNRFMEKGTVSYDEWGKSPLLCFGRFILREKTFIISKIRNSGTPLKEIENIQIDRGLEGGKNSLLLSGNNRILIPENIDRYSVSDTKYYTNSWKNSFEKKRILVIRIRNLKIRRRIIATIEKRKTATLKTIQQIYFNAASNCSLEYIIGILNSNLLNFYCTHFLVDDINKVYIGQLPIRAIDFTSSDDKSLHDKMAFLVDRMLDLQKKYSKSSLPQEKTVLQRQMESTDRQIDQLVYKLYDLTDEEIKVVEADSVSGR